MVMHLLASARGNRLSVRLAHRFRHERILPDSRRVARHVHHSSWLGTLRASGFCPEARSNCLLEASHRNTVYHPPGVSWCRNHISRQHGFNTPVLRTRDAVYCLRKGREAYTVFRALPIHNRQSFSSNVLECGRFQRTLAQQSCRPKSGIPFLMVLSPRSSTMSRLFHDGFPNVAIQIMPPERTIGKQTKRKRQTKVVDSIDGSNSGNELAEDIEALEIAELSVKRQRTVRIKEVRMPGLLQRKFVYRDNQSTLPAYEESSALEELLWLEGVRGNTSYGGQTFTSLDLDDFTIYRPAPRRGVRPDTRLPDEFVALHDCTFKKETTKVYYFDGVITNGSIKRHVRRVRIKAISIGGYEDADIHTVGPDIWIQSAAAHKPGVWYRLREPATEYRRFHRSYLWMVDFAKHVVDFLKNNEHVSIHSFKCRFHEWLIENHSGDVSFRDWLAEYGDTDFRRAVSSFSNFLLSQARDLDEVYELHPVWSEVHPKNLGAIPVQPRHEVKTVVTQYVFEHFKHFKWSAFLSPHVPSPKVENVRRRMRWTSDPQLVFRTQRAKKSKVESAAHKEQIADSNRFSVRVGDVVELKKDEDSRWKGDDQSWYAYVQGIEGTQEERGLRVIWLARPSDTTCCSGHYSFSNELFLTDLCNCRDEDGVDMDAIPLDEVLSKVSVAFFGGPVETEAEFFVRQKFNHKYDSRQTKASFVTLKQSDLRCSCKQDVPGHGYRVGDTVLVFQTTSSGKEVLEPVEVMDLAPDGSSNSVRVRRLLRRCRDYGAEDAEPNDLVYSNRLETIPLETIDRRCHVRAYTLKDRDEQRIPAPYCRGGTADAFYVIFQEDAQYQTLQPFQLAHSSSLRQGPDFQAESSLTPLRGLDLFSGGGSLGRGLEEGGAVQFQWAVDYSKEAMHTYHANLREPGDAQLFCGSVDDYLAQAMRGAGGDLVAQVGEVEYISAGSPCQGFSNLNGNRNSEESLINVSKIASVLSYIDFYRPLRHTFENVLALAKGDEFSQMICALVGMGYQVQQCLIDAWTHGSPQSRERMFISITAQGLTPQSKPPHTHSHPVHLTNRSFGLLADGTAFGGRTWPVTPFEYVTIGEATADLPYNHDGLVLFPAHPYHQMSANINPVRRMELSYVLRFPRLDTIVQARERGELPQALIDADEKFWANKIRSRSGSAAMQRVHPDALLPTLSTKCTAEDGILGRVVHWDAQRLLTVEEARRAQGIPRREVIVGSPSQQWKIIGNGVARHVAIALGVSLRFACMADQGPQPTARGTRVDDRVSSQATTELQSLNDHSTSGNGPVLIIPDSNGRYDSQPESESTDSSDVDELADDIHPPSALQPRRHRKPGQMPRRQAATGATISAHSGCLDAISISSGSEIPSSRWPMHQSASSVLDKSATLAKPTSSLSVHSGRRGLSTVQEVIRSTTHITKATTTRRETTVTRRETVRPPTTPSNQSTRRPQPTLGESSTDGHPASQPSPVRRNNRNLVSGASPDAAIEID